MARKIAFINYKGGVGKTSLIVNTAASFARRGMRVLLIDLDTQSNASIWLMKLERWNKINAGNTGSVYSIFDPGTQRLKDVVVRDVVEDKEGAKALPGLDLIPTTFNLVDLEGEYKPDAKRPSYAIFQEQLAELEPSYDIILFDCPPNILRASQNGIYCAQEIYVPANPDALSLIGFTLLIEKLIRFQQSSASFRVSSMGQAAQVQGIIFNAIKSNKRGVAATAKIFSTQIRDAMVVRRAVTLGMPVFLVGTEAGEEDSVSNDYLKLAGEILDHSTAAYH